jgi:putative smr protein/mutS2
VRRKIKPIGADYALPRAGILFGKDRLTRRDKTQPARFLNREILILRRVVIARRKVDLNAAAPRLNLALTDLFLFTSERRLPSRAFKFTPPETDFTICAQ